MVLLDTDHVSVLRFEQSPRADALRKRLQAAAEPLATTVVTVEEKMRGWLAEIHRLADPHRQIPAYQQLHERIEFFARWTVLPWDTAAAELFLNLRQQGVRIGSMDLKIACIALVHESPLLTRNPSDFGHVPGLRVENWTQA